jgi:hypothetical protein
MGANFSKMGQLTLFPSPSCIRAIRPAAASPLAINRRGLNFRSGGGVNGGS